jgi:peroxiredoxin
VVQASKLSIPLKLSALQSLIAAENYKETLCVLTAYFSFVLIFHQGRTLYHLKMTWWWQNAHNACPTCSELEVKMEASDFSVQALGEIEVYNEDNDTVLLSTLWADKTAVLFFVRHFGWVLCRQQVAEIVQNKSGFANKDLRLAVIGSDETQYFKEFRRVTGYSGLLLSDPSRNWLSPFSVLPAESPVF